MRGVAIDPALQPLRQAEDERVGADAGVGADAPDGVARLGMRAKEIGDEGEDVVHLRVAALVRRLAGRHGVGAHPEAFDPAVDELIGLVERDVVVDEIAEPLRDLGGEALDAIGETGIERAGAVAGGLDVERPACCARA